MREFFISPKVAKYLLMWTASSIVGLSVVCAIFDKDDEDAVKTVRLNSQSVKEITAETRKTNILLEEQSVKIGEMNNSMIGILGIAKGTLELSPSFEPSINLQPGRPKRSRKPQKDTLVIEKRVYNKDSIIIINKDGFVSDSTSTTTHRGTLGMKCCCCDCCCNGCNEKEGCR